MASIRFDAPAAATLALEDSDPALWFDGLVSQPGRRLFLPRAPTYLAPCPCRGLRISYPRGRRA